ncbi:MAG TPA: rod shape-determining protein MreD [Rhodopila sp.]|jgi:rod shape-determining protein MreD|nr:rod shape-determining protein MreD [Rhodopila sp.]
MAHIDRRPGIRPRPSVGRRLDIAARASFPACITVLLMLLTQAPVGLPEQAASLPAVTLGCVWFWSLFRPAALPPPIVFLMGLLMDLLGYLPLGVGAFTLLAVHGVALTMRRSLSQRGGAWIWIVFAGVAAAASLVIWLMVMLLTFRLLSPYPAIFIAVLAIALFPVLAVPFASAHRSIANPERA